MCNYVYAIMCVINPERLIYQQIRDRGRCCVCVCVLKSVCVCVSWNLCMCVCVCVRADWIVRRFDAYVEMDR